MKKLPLIISLVIVAVGLVFAELEPLEKLMPKLEARQTTNGMWHVWSMAHNETNWSECMVDLPTKEKADATIRDVKFTLTLKYEVGKMMADAFKPKDAK